MGLVLCSRRTCVEFFELEVGMGHLGHFRLLLIINAGIVGRPGTKSCSALYDANIENTSNRNKLNVLKS